MTSLKKIVDFFLRSFYFFQRRNKKLIVYCGARDLFIDNCKYQFLHNNEKLPSYRHVWLTKNTETLNLVRSLGFEALDAGSVEGVKCQKKAGFCIFDDGLGFLGTSFFLTGAVRINLWHGVPAKFITSGRQEPNSDYNKKTSIVEKIRHGHIRGDLGFCTSSNLIRIFTNFYSLQKSKILIGAYPRTFPLVLKDQNLKDFLSKYERAEIVRLYESLSLDSRKKIIYMPTFRDGNSEYMHEAIPDWNALNRACVQSGSVLFVKVHRAALMPDNLELSNVKVIDKYLDIYPILSLFDILITDYSSIMFDFSLTGKEVLLYTYDIDEYAKKSRNIYAYFWNLINDLTCVHSFEELTSFLSSESVQTKKFPVDAFFDYPLNFDVVSTFIASNEK